MFGGMAIVGCAKNAPAESSPTSFCAQVSVFVNSNADLDSTFASADKAQVSAGLALMSRQLSTMEASAPAELKIDLSEMTGFMTKLDAVLAKVGYDINRLEQDEAAIDEFTALPREQFVASRDALIDYARTTCSVVAEPTAPSTSSSQAQSETTTS
jgi:hypothetical protein